MSGGGFNEWRAAWCYAVAAASIDGRRRSVSWSPVLMLWMVRQ